MENIKIQRKIAYLLSIHNFRKDNKNNRFMDASHNLAVEHGKILNF